MVKKVVQDNTTGERSSWLGVAVPMGGFLLVVIVALVLWVGQQRKVHEHLDTVAHYNATVGLPESFPSDLIPLYKDAQVKSGTKGEATSKDGHPMDEWDVVAQVDNDDRKAIFDYYNNMLLDKGFRQTQLISMPSYDKSGPNYAVDYGSEDMSLSFVIEKKTTDPMTQLQIKVYKVK